MKMKSFKGKAIYNPSGKAGEYSYWACNFYTGCSNACEYCYCRKGFLASTWSEKPKLKKCFKSIDDALNIFQIEMQHNIEELRKHGLFFSFTTDPCLKETMFLTFRAMNICNKNNIPVKILTKMAMNKGQILQFIVNQNQMNKELIAVGFTLTGHDELERNASTNDERIEAMQNLYDNGYKTFASIEPIIDFESAFQMIKRTRLFCDLYKIGLKSGEHYDLSKLHEFMDDVWSIIPDLPTYWKDTLLEQAGIDRKDLPSNCVDRNYNLFL